MGQAVATPVMRRQRRVPKLTHVPSHRMRSDGRTACVSTTCQGTCHEETRNIRRHRRCRRLGPGAILGHAVRRARRGGALHRQRRQHGQVHVQQRPEFQPLGPAGRRRPRRRLPRRLLARSGHQPRYRHRCRSGPNLQPPPDRQPARWFRRVAPGSRQGRHLHGGRGVRRLRRQRRCRHRPLLRQAGHQRRYAKACRQQDRLLPPRQPGRALRQCLGRRR